MIKHGLATIWRKLCRPIYHGISPVLIVIALSLVADGVFWYFGVNGSAKNQSAFIQLATGWTVAVMTLVAGLFLSARSEAKSSRNIKRAAYAAFLSLSDKLVAAQADFAITESACDVARSEFDAADEQASLIPDEMNLNARLVAVAKLTKAKGALDSATATAQDVLEAYRAAETAAAKIVTPSVRSAFDEFSKCPPENTPVRAGARLRFVQAAEADLGIPLTTQLTA